MKTVCIILNYNDADTTIALLHRIRDYRSLDGIILVDNASTDDSAVRLRKEVGGKVLLAEAPENGGYGAGNNLGIRYAAGLFRADFALIANPDTEFSDDCVRTLAETMERRPSLGVIAPVQVTPAFGEKAAVPGSRENTLTGPAAWPLRPWFYDLLESGPVCRRIFRPLLHYSTWKYTGRKLVRVDCVPGSLLMVDVQRMLSCGGFDERVFLYEEEYILGQRMRAAGAETALHTGVKYLHHHGVSIGKSRSSMLSRQKLREKSTLYYFRHYLRASKASLLFTRLFFAVVNLETGLADLNAAKTHAPKE